MAPGSPSFTSASELPEEASSPEHPSTRPNPFDDGEISSRKRRRTSASGSPTASLDTVNPVHDASSSTTLEGEQSRSGSAMAVDEKPATPRTPEQRQASLEPPPSRVTINLRRRSESASPPGSPASLEPRSEVDPTPPESVDIRRDARTPGEETAEAPLLTLGARHRQDSARALLLKSSRSTRQTRFMPAARGEMEMDISAASSAAGAVDDIQQVADPTAQFPYCLPPERLSVTLQRLADYFSSNKIMDGHVFDDVVTWLNDYLKFAKQSDPLVVLESRIIHRDFWHAFPQAVASLLPRTWELLRNPILRHRLLSLYAAFARLTAHNIALDTMALRSSPPAEGVSAPTILAPAYIQQLRNTVSSLDCQPDPFNESVSEPGWNPANLEAHLVRILHDSPAGCAKGLAELVDALASAVSRWPKLADNFAALSWALKDHTRAALRTSNESQDEDACANSDLAACHLMMETMSTSLMAVIDKHIASLNPECASTTIQNLAEVLPLSLRSGSQGSERSPYEPQNSAPFA
ncbi:hypothetical protein ACCO45_011497 [Purpureocillium lilacinum]|uniref:Uncharacterized protein n=1 Tax=Purpureocillium lilacinum TaxID=33203 RepID=A0ACC4DBB4_PURLI